MQYRNIDKCNLNAENKAECTFVRNAS